MATIGRAKAVADIQGLQSLVTLGCNPHIFSNWNRFRVFAEWIWHYITFKRGVRLISKKELLD